MNEDYFDRSVDDLELEPDDDMGYSPRDESVARRKSSLAFWPKILVFGGAVIVLIIILFALFSGENSEISTKDLAAVNTRVDLLENRLTRLEEVELRIASLQEESNTLRKSLMETQTLINSLNQSLDQRVEELANRIEAQKEEAAARVKQPKAREVVSEKPASPSKAKIHEVRQGETLYRISSKYGLTVDELRRLNDISRNQPIYPGQKLIVGPKGQ